MIQHHPQAPVAVNFPCVGLSLRCVINIMDYWQTQPGGLHSNGYIRTYGMAFAVRGTGGIQYVGAFRAE